MRPLDFLGRIKVKLGIVMVGAVVTAFVVNEVGINGGVPRDLRIAFAVFLALLMMQVLARGMTKPLREMAAAAQTIAKGSYGLRVTATSRDEVGELARAFNAMAADLAEVDRQRRELVANVSHELRTPITGVQAVLENVVDGVSPPEPEILGTALAQTQRLGRLVAQLLDLSRLDSGARPIEAEEFDLAALGGQAVREASLGRDDVTVVAAIDPGRHLTTADPSLLAQVLANLLDNAVRHSPPGGTVTLTSRASADGTLEIEVADEGPGIPPADRQRVFERFSRLDAGRAADAGGAGLGLAIAKEIAELHGGTIAVADGTGCHMVVTLPKAVRERRTPVDAVHTRVPATSRSRTDTEAGSVKNPDPTQTDPLERTASTSDTGAHSAEAPVPLTPSPAPTAQAATSAVAPDPRTAPASPGDLLRRTSPSEAPAPAERVASTVGAAVGGSPLVAASSPTTSSANGATASLAAAEPIEARVTQVIDAAALSPGGAVPPGEPRATQVTDAAVPSPGHAVPNGEPGELRATRTADAVALSPGQAVPNGEPGEPRATRTTEAVALSPGQAVPNGEPGKSRATRTAEAVALSPGHAAPQDEPATSAAAAHPAPVSTGSPPASPEIAPAVSLVGAAAPAQVSSDGSIRTADTSPHPVVVPPDARQPVPRGQTAPGGPTSPPGARQGTNDGPPPGRSFGGAVVGAIIGALAGLLAGTVAAVFFGTGPNTEIQAAGAFLLFVCVGIAAGASLGGRVGTAPEAAGGQFDAYTPPPLFPRPSLPDTPRWVLPAAAGTGLVAAVCFPYAPTGLGVVLTAVALTLAVAPAVRHRVNAWSVAYAVAAYGLVSVALFRDADWLVGLTLLAAFAVASLAVSGGRGWAGVTRGLLSVGLAVFPVPWFLGGPVRRILKRRSLLPVLVSLGITAILLAVFGVLFASADAVFSSFARELFSAPAWAGTLPVRIFLFVVFGVLAAAAILVALRPVAEPRVDYAPLNLARTLWVIPLVGVNLLFAAFVGVQISVLFGGSRRVLETAGLTFAEYARSGFFELITVSVFVLCIVAFCSVMIKGDRWIMATLLGLLCALTLVILASALHRLGLYTAAYGFTRLRASVGATIWWIAAVFVLVLVGGLVKRRAWLPKALVLLTAVSLMVFAVWNPDAQVAETQVSVRGVDRLDAHYLGRLSADAIPGLDRLPEPIRSCVLQEVIETQDLRFPDPWNGWNLSRRQAAEILAAHPVDRAVTCEEKYRSAY
ncbi:DUF4153 domain-containing protein [Herbidospora sp. NBRC 101105]|uniref:DUF4153 domain-containing protein n=1 Tax=Herbidospora sp. NBRC 101105 TaxID=3032195 RepID=UPI0024A0B525|nr:DUF4153 domain-containing protein [Herbidospora sp. NBRC 101105]GLX98382.1 hypothetical protein Hesp01_63320 [Herbidospora sp. NBRC 101105]